MNQHSEQLVAFNADTAQSEVWTFRTMDETDGGQKIVGTRDVVSVGGHNMDIPLLLSTIGAFLQNKSAG